MAAEVYEMNAMPVLHSLRDASKESGVSYDTLRRWCLQNKVAHVRVGKCGGKFLVNMNDLATFLNNSGKE